MSLQTLSRALRLPQAELYETTVEGCQLWLLNQDIASVQMDAQAIAHFWQALPYWAFAWAGGQALAAYIRQNPHTVAGKRVLDFGCGSGLVGIVAAQCGAKEVWMLDSDPNALLAAQMNAELNDCQIQCIHQDWPEVDLLLASDVLYDLNSQADLKQLMLKIPNWLLAEPPQVAPTWIELAPLSHYQRSTLPLLDDFDKAVEIDILGRI